MTVVIKGGAFGIYGCMAVITFLMAVIASIGGIQRFGRFIASLANNGAFRAPIKIIRGFDNVRTFRTFKRTMGTPMECIQGVREKDTITIGAKRACASLTLILIIESAE